MNACCRTKILEHTAANDIESLAESIWFMSTHTCNSVVCGSLTLMVQSIKRIDGGEAACGPWVRAKESLHPSRHYEIRLSQTQLCGVNQAPLQQLGPSQCAPGAQYQSMAASRSRHNAADCVANAASGGFALFETERSVLGIHSACLLTRFTSWHRCCEGTQNCVETAVHTSDD